MANGGHPKPEPKPEPKKPVTGQAPKPDARTKR